MKFNSTEKSYCRYCKVLLEDLDSSYHKKCKDLVISFDSLNLRMFESINWFCEELKRKNIKKLRKIIITQNTKLFVYKSGWILANKIFNRFNKKIKPNNLMVKFNLRFQLRFIP
jgi:hypothetical protein